jgi:hypothetical protein
MTKRYTMNTRIRWICPVLLNSLALLFLGCASTSGSGSTNDSTHDSTHGSTTKKKVKRTSLSDAAEAAKTDSKDQETVEATEEYVTEEEDDDDGGFWTGILVGLFAGSPEEESAPNPPPTMQLTSIGPGPYYLPANSFEIPAPPDTGKSGSGLFYGGLTASAMKYDGDEILSGFSLNLAFGEWESQRLRPGIVFFFSHLELSRQAALSFKDTWELGIAGRVRYYLTERHTFMGVYGMASFGLGLMHFSFQNSIDYEDETGTHTASSDLLATFTPELGLGLGIVQTRFFKMGGIAFAGLKFFGTSTVSHGFENDLFEPAGYVGLGLTMSFSGK